MTRQTFKNTSTNNGSVSIFQIRRHKNESRGVLICEEKKVLIIPFEMALISLVIVLLRLYFFLKFKLFQKILIQRLATKIPFLYIKKYLSVLSREKLFKCFKKNKILFSLLFQVRTPQLFRFSYIVSK